MDLKAIRAFDNVITITANDREVAHPSRFPARVYVGDSIQFVAQNGDRVGVPLGFHERVTPPPLLSMGGGCLFGEDGGVGQAVGSVGWNAGHLYYRLTPKTSASGTRGLSLQGKPGQSRNGYNLVAVT